MAAPHDDFTFMTGDVDIQMDAKGCCVKHPHVQLRVEEDGYVYQKESCPDCEADLESKLQEMKQKRYDLDRKLEDLEDNEDSYDASHQSRSSSFVPPATTFAAPTTNNAPTLESLSQQMTQMQGMQDWLLQQKEQEMTMLRQKVEDQQKQLVQKEVEMALLKEKLAQQESRMQHELKLIKMAAYNRQRRHQQSNRSFDTTEEESKQEAKSPQDDSYVVIKGDHQGDTGVTNNNNNTKDHSSEESYEEVMPSPPLQRRPTPDPMPEVDNLPAPPSLLPRAPSGGAGSDENSSEQQDTFDVNYIPQRFSAAPKKGKLQTSNDDELLQRGVGLGGDVPVNIDLSGPTPVDLQEQVTMDTFLGDAGRFEHAQAHNVQQQQQQPQDNSDAFTMGNTVASSTYGEDRHKVVNQTVLDPYGDSGQYTGVVLLTTGMPHGLGRMQYEDDGRTYEGDWRHGRWHGFGKATFANGDAYEGEYRFDQRHGRGLYQWSDGRQYDGDFYEDKRHGRGTFHWPDGAIYEGDFVQGQREGHGRYSFADGGQYVGEWVDGRYEGYGECVWSDGRSYKGDWSQGMANGRGVETFADGTVRHDGLWERDDPILEE